MKRLYVLIIILASIIFANLIDYKEIKAIENCLITTSLVFLGGAFALYGIISTLILPIITDKIDKLTSIGLKKEDIVGNIQSFMGEIYQAIIGILITFGIAVFLPLIKSILLKKYIVIATRIIANPESTICYLHQFYLFIILVCFFYLFFTIIDLIRATKKLNEFNMLTMT